MQQVFLIKYFNILLTLNICHGHLGLYHQRGHIPDLTDAGVDEALAKDVVDTEDFLPT